jgi:hypothetical protein
LGTLLERSLPIATQPNYRIITQILVTFITLTIVAETLFNSVIYILNIQLTSRTLTIGYLYGYLFYFMFSVIFNLVYFGAIYFFNWKKNLVNIACIQRDKAMVTYDVLRSHLNPHFLFNAFTSLNSLIFENQQLASDFLQQLSKVYRYVLQYKEKDTVPLLIEFDFISNYIRLLETRFNKGIEFNIQLNDEAKEKGIVPITLQILIENAIKHNVVSVSHPLKIWITNSDSSLIIRNSINKKLYVETSNNQGMARLKSLYNYLAERPIEIIENDRYYSVSIPLL